METNRLAASSAPTATVLTAAAIADLPVLPLGNIEGIHHRVLWDDGTSMAGVMTIAAGSRLGEHAHRANQHHLWVLDGHALILGAVLGPGGYTHVPAGLVHDIDATATDGCTVYYLYVR